MEKIPCLYTQSWEDELFIWHEVYRNLLKIKKPNSTVKGDIPKKLISQYPYLWARPESKIFNEVIQSTE